MASLHDPLWREHFRAACALHPDAARRLTVEITEQGAAADPEAARAVLLALKAFSVRIAISEVGGAASSCRGLRDMPIDYLKVSGRFTRGVQRSGGALREIGALMAIARGRGIATIAQWIEDEDTARLLASCGVDLLQGHLFGQAEITAEGAVRAAS